MYIMTKEEEKLLQKLQNNMASKLLERRKTHQIE